MPLVVPEEYGQLPPAGCTTASSVAVQVEHHQFPHTPAEAVAIANDTSYGLSAGVISEDISLAMKIAGEIDTGLVHINGPTVDDEPMAAFGGVGDSGFGRFGGQDALREFTEPRWVTRWDHRQRQVPI